MPQVVDSSNLVQLVTTGSVPEFKAPEAAKPEVKPTDAPDAKTTDTPKEGGQAKAADGAAKADAGKEEPARDESGKFVKADDAAKAAPGDDDETDSLPEPIKKKIDRIVGKKHRRMADAEDFARERDADAVRERARADAAERELQRIRGGKSDGPKAGEGESVDPDEPKQADFKTVGEYTRALVKFEAKRAGEVGARQRAEKIQQERHEEALDVFAGRQDEFRKSNPNYDKIVGDANLEVPQPVTDYILENETGPAIMLYLSQNPDENTRLKKLSPRRQLAELGKIETKLEAAQPAPNKVDAAKPAAKEVSKAPAPIAPLEAKTTPVQKDPSQMSVSELREHRRQEALAKSGR